MPPTLTRNLDRLAGRSFDVLVIGCGIYGAWAAWDAALRGLSVAVIDQGDIGSATSANNLRVVHGGLRYLQHLDLNRMRESIREQSILLRVAPHLVHPLPCVVPCYGAGMRSRWALRTALLMNDLVGFDRNRGAAPGKAIPRGRMVGKARMKEIAPGIPDRGLTGGALWHDAQVRDPERMVLAILQSACKQGADVANYVAAESLLVEKNRVVGARVRDRIGGDDFFLRARVTLNLAGPWADQVLQSAFPGRVPRLFPFSQAWNLVFGRRGMLDMALGIYSNRSFKDSDRKMSRSSRLLFLTPLRDVLLAGTSHRPFVPVDEGAEVGHSEEEIEHFLEEVSDAYPAAELSRDDVVHAYGGLLPGEVDRATGNVRLLKHPVIRDHGVADNVRGLITGVGVKFTTARLVAGKLVDLAAGYVGGSLDRCRTHETPLLPGDIEDWEAFVAEAESHRMRAIPPVTFNRLVENHGTGFKAVVHLAREEGQLLNLVDDGCPTLQAEVVHAVREEMAVKLMDVVRRRTDIGKCGLRSEHLARRAAALMAGELGWSEARKQQEIQEVCDVYRPFLGG